jgi:hypothetical protein
MVSTLELISLLNLLRRDNGKPALEEPAAIALLQKAETAAANIVGMTLGDRRREPVVVIIDTTSGYAYNSDGIYPIPSQVNSLHHIRSIRTASNDPMKRYGSYRHLVDNSRRLGESGYRLLGPENPGEAQRLQFYPIPASGTSITFELHVRQRRLNVYREAFGTLDREESLWSYTSGRFPFTADELLGCWFHLEDQGELLQLDITENTTDKLTLDYAGTGSVSNVPAAIDIPTDLPEEVADFLPLVAQEIASRGSVSRQTRNQIRTAVQDMDLQHEHIPRPRVHDYLKGLTGNPVYQTRRNPQDHYDF